MKNSPHRWLQSRCPPVVLVLAISTVLNGNATAQQLDAKQKLQLVRAAEAARVAVIDRVMDSVIAIYGDDREGGGSGVIIDPSGIGLTNHHVIAGAGVEGWGGLADGKLYRWSVVGTDPGGDIAIIQMHGRSDFPFSPLGDSSQVRVGDWAMAMGNPFVLSEDESPTVTLGIVSGVNRFQEGAGSNQLVYGNCIQVDSSINPGNSGGPLFNMSGQVIGINGRGSFEERGRVNVGLGYAISANQIKNFIPDLLATKLVEHGTLDATFDWRDGKVVCSSIDQNSDVFQKGLALGDELLEFEGTEIQSVNQYLNLICTLPETWPARLKIRKPEGDVQEIFVRMYGLPYNYKAPPPPALPKDQEPTPAQKRAMERQQAMVRLMTTPAGTVRDAEVNQRYVKWLLDHWWVGRKSAESSMPCYTIVDRLESNGEVIGQHQLQVTTDQRFRIDWTERGQTVGYGFDGETFWKSEGDRSQAISIVEAKLTAPIVHALAVASQFGPGVFDALGTTSLDGSDKADHRLAARIKILDERGDWLYCWFNLFDAENRFHVYPLKISASLNGDRPGGAMLFSDWRPVEGLQLAMHRRWAFGMAEIGAIALVNQSVTASELPDESVFRQPGQVSGKAPTPSPTP